MQNYAPLTIDQFRQALREKGLKATSQRVAVHEAMLGLGHASADMVSQSLALKGEKITVASVYNILSQLSLLGIYCHRMSVGNKMFFDVNTFRHMHLYDIVNNEYRDIIDDEVMDMVESKLKKRRFKGFKIDAVDIQLVCHPTHMK